MGAIASQITSLKIVYSTVYSDADERKHQSSASNGSTWWRHHEQSVSDYIVDLTAFLLDLPHWNSACIWCKKDTFECRNAVRYNIILHTSLQWLTQNIYFSFNSQKTSHSSSVRQDMGCLLWVLTLPIVRILEKIDRVITVPRCNYHLEMSFPCGDHVVVMLSVRHAATFDKFGHLTWNNPSSCRVFPPKFLT